MSSSAFRVLVPIKRVVDFGVKVRVNAAKSAVETANVKMSMNPFCEIATEEAVRLRESNVASEVVVLTIGPKGAVETLRTALAMGADRGIHVETPPEVRTDHHLQPLSVSKIIAAIAQRESPNLIVMGKQSIDSDANQCGQMVAAKLNWPIATFASKVAISSDKQSADIVREVDGGLQKVTIAMPAVITADLRLNQPRYPTIPNIRKSAKKQVDVIEVSTLGVDIKGRLEVIRVDEPPARKAGGKVDSVDALIHKLKNEAKVI